ADAVFSVRIFDGDWNWASAEFHVRFPHLMTEAPYGVFIYESTRIVSQKRNLLPSFRWVR
ncbi:hypothetical protein N8642_04170, partial [bacterium]|nr:hypothetical protein [bacterium]